MCSYAIIKSLILINNFVGVHSNDVLKNREVFDRWSDQVELISFAAFIATILILNELWARIKTTVYEFVMYIYDFYKFIIFSHLYNNYIYI